ncbi:MAG: hypothetical protein J0M12_02555 [Deltaproteobacteria bacterium]|nr:hypothetical protein [Deltaproteobacteria bacterium]
MKRIIVALLCVGIVGCAKPVPTRPSLISETRTPVVRMKTIELPVSRKELNAALDRPPPANDIRMVLVFRGAPGMSDQEQPPPEYRFFDVRPESAYALLGLRNGDILVAAHDHIVYNPLNFPNYVASLVTLPDGFVEIRRAGEPVKIQYVLRE